ncbi:helix-turn-helix domain-containing protein [Thalassotalea aquiviva]|uniref:helix-turn-helix domain-containing protein n=1 Tax=Thalassotalea aquiviva TaxID=3242415 RepID=UPI00352BCA0F
MKQLTTYNALLGFELEKQRKEKGLEQSQIADLAGISQPVLSRLEKGKALITIDQLFVICKALEVNPEHIIRKVNSGVKAIEKENKVDITTTKSASDFGPILTGAAIGSLLTLFLKK